MTKHFLKDAFGWGFILWLIGYALGMLFFAVVPANLIGWVITPIGTVLTILVLFKKVNGHDLKYYVVVALVWVAIAIVCDYAFLVVPFKLTATYYKPDIYLYYSLTLLLPILIGWRKLATRKV